MQLAEDFDRLYRTHYDFVWRNARHLGVPTETLDDVLQETFLVAYRRLPEFDGRAKPSTWLYGILHNVWRNHRRGARRRDRKRVALSEQQRFDVVHRVRASELEAQAELAQRLLDEFLADLDPGQRSVFTLAELEGMSGPEIAAALDLNLNTARGRLRAARRAFEHRFQSQPAVLALARSLRDEPPRASNQQRARTRALVLAGLGPVEPAAAAFGTLGLAKLLPALLGLGLAAVAVGVLADPLEHTDAPVHAAAPPKKEVAGPAESPPAPPPAPAEDEPIEVVADAAPHSVPRSHRRPERLPEARSDSSLATLEQARAALIGGDPARALDLAATLDPGGALAWERTVTEVAALCRLDRNDAAKTTATRWNAHHTRTIAAVCW